MKKLVATTLDLNLKTLRLPTMLREYSNMAQRSIEQKLSCEQYLNCLTELEVQDRHNKKITSLMKGAKFPLTKTLDQYNFHEVKGINEQQVHEICSGNFIEDYNNIIFVGPPGSGKSHLSIAIGRELCLKGVKVLFTTTCYLVQELIKAKNSLNLSSYFKRLGKYKLIIIDELGFIPFDKKESDLLFQFISDRYEKGSLLITTNLVFSEWDKIFKDLATTTAVVDRIIHHSLIFEMDSDSYRSKEANKRLTKKNKM